MRRAPSARDRRYVRSALRAPTTPCRPAGITSKEELTPPGYARRSGRARTSIRDVTLPRVRGVLAVLAIATVAVLSGCATGAAPSVALPPEGGVPDYQLGGAYPPDPSVQIVARDRTSSPLEDVYSICYVNGFQTQPGDLDLWPDEVLLRRDGEPVIDPAWPDEVILDTSTEASRSAIVEVLRPWIEGCAASGFRAVEFDNLDTFSRSDGALTLDDNLALAVSLVDIAHEAGLAAGQKNAAEYAERLHADAGFDFAVTEECAVFDECAAYTDVYGAHVIDIEYTDELPAPFADLCRRAPASTVLRDRALSVPGSSDYAFETCAALG